jgi:hypothetical protein
MLITIFATPFAVLSAAGAYVMTQDIMVAFLAYMIAGCVMMACLATVAYFCEDLPKSE